MVNVLLNDFIPVFHLEKTILIYFCNNLIIQRNSLVELIIFNCRYYEHCEVGR